MKKIVRKCTFIKKQSTIQRLNKIELYCLLFVHACSPLYGGVRLVGLRMITPDSSSRVRGPKDLFRCQGRGVLLGTKGAFHVSVDCYDTAWSGHLKFEIGIVWHRIEASKCGSSEQGVIATAEWGRLTLRFGNYSGIRRPLRV